MLTIKEIVVKINQGISYEEAETLITQKVEFHTNAALKAAYENQMIEQYKKEEKYDYPDSSHFRATKQSILNAYDKNLII